MKSMNTEAITVVGMTCSHCVKAVTEEITALDGVTDVSVDLESGRVQISSDAPIERSALEAAVDEAGYELAPS